VAIPGHNRVLISMAGLYVKQTFRFISYENTEYGFSWETGVTMKSQ